MASILFVCLGNICRSPAAEGLLRKLSEQEAIAEALHIESCGMGDWHIGQLADERMRHAAEGRGVILSSRAQQFHPSFLEKFDFILAADNEVLNDLYRHAKNPEHKAKIHLITAFSTCYKGHEIPDPYYGGEGGFEQVLDMIEDACLGLIAHIKSQQRRIK